VLCLLSDGRLLVVASESGYLAIGVVHGGLFECNKFYSTTCLKIREPRVSMIRASLPLLVKPSPGSV